MRLAVVAPAVAVLLIRGAAARADYQLVPPDKPRAAKHGGAGPDLLYLNRCVGDCTVTRDGRRNSAQDNVSSISPGTSTLTEFGYSDFIWDAVVACVADTYSPYGVEVVTDEPPASADYVEVMIAGTPDELGQGSNVLGIAPMANDCSPQTNWIAFAFANAHGQDPVIELCATASHEAGHVYGLEHVFDCKDAMTYLTDCGHKWFLALDMRCGEFDLDDCICGGDTQNSHARLIDALGEGTLPPPPQVSIPYPMDGASVIQEFNMFGSVVEERVVTRIEFRLNGFPWERQPGQRDATDYAYRAPPELPDGIIDLEFRAYNDLQRMGSEQITVVKGEPCTSSSACLDGQSCEDGRCAWPPPTVEFGEACERDADCVSYECISDGERSLCTDLCVLGLDSCPQGYRCLEDSDGSGVCWPDDPGGCCSAGGDPGGAALGLLGLGLLLTRGRDRRRPGSRSRS